MRNDGRSWYNSFQTSYSIRNRWTTFRANYTFSKTMEKTGFLDPQMYVMQKGPAAYDVPNHFSMSAVSQLPFGKTGRKFKKKLLGGWQHSLIIQRQSGRPWGLPTNVLYTKQAGIDVDWSGSVVKGLNNCVAQWNSNGTIPLSHRVLPMDARLRTG
jgi:hypothetical protein